LQGTMEEISEMLVMAPVPTRVAKLQQQFVDDDDFPERRGASLRKHVGDGPTAISDVFD